MIRYILVDDEPKTTERVKLKIDTLAKDYNLHYVKSYNSSIKAFNEIHEDEYDILIVDFDMPGFNGIELAQKVATGKKVIFLTSTTNNEKLVINSLDIAGYLSKPFETAAFELILKNKIVGKISTVKQLNKNNLITLHVGSNTDIRFKPEQVYYIGTSKNINGELPDKNCVHIYGKNDQVIYRNVRKTINELSITLNSYNFKKTSKSTIVNMSHLKVRDNNDISLFDCQETFKIMAKEKNRFVALIRGLFES